MVLESRAARPVSANPAKAASADRKDSAAVWSRVSDASTDCSAATDTVKDRFDRICGSLLGRPRKWTARVLVRESPSSEIQTLLEDGSATDAPARNAWPASID